MQFTKMETHVYFHIVNLLILLYQPGSSIFVEKGRNVQLDVPGYEKYKEEIDSFTSLLWRSNKNNVVKHDTRGTVVSPKYNGRVKFSEENLSLLLENIQEGDSGRYSAVLSGYTDIIIAEHLISVQVRVEPPVLTVDSSTNGTCNVTVTCRSQNTTVTSNCNSSTCSPVGVESSGVETSSVSLLSFYVTGGTIICNYSNQVSWANDTKKMCVSGLPLIKEHYLLIFAIYAPVILLLSLLFILILWIYFYCQKRNKTRKTDIVNTDYATVEGAFNGGAGGGQVILSSGPESSTIYSEVQPVNSPIMQGDPHVSMEQPLTHKPPESIYAMVERNPSKK
ncbi:hypothetical protein DPEC_G00059260 [Dallia pectoralis]|uniref:Uncharacterized protein n=1 Tax=Dallia pectoralis TaxID=75939 RepID=A0ACC2H6I1_DALPE|nr:hypothetical protein DPEC_G00059260 [Dallia pectoralis]